jgi:hypothetical protein
LWKRRAYPVEISAEQYYGEGQLSNLIPKRWEVSFADNRRVVDSVRGRFAKVKGRASERKANTIWGEQQSLYFH